MFNLIHHSVLLQNQKKKKKRDLQLKRRKASTTKTIIVINSKDVFFILANMQLNTEPLNSITIVIGIRWVVVIPLWLVSLKNKRKMISVRWKNIVFKEKLFFISYNTIRFAWCQVETTWFSQFRGIRFFFFKKNKFYHQYTSLGSIRRKWLSKMAYPVNELLKSICPILVNVLLCSS